MYVLYYMLSFSNPAPQCNYRVSRWELQNCPNVCSAKIGAYLDHMTSKLHALHGKVLDHMTRMSNWPTRSWTFKKWKTLGQFCESLLHVRCDPIYRYQGARSYLKALSCWLLSNGASTHYYLIGYSKVVPLCLFMIMPHCAVVTSTFLRLLEDYRLF